MYVGSLYGEYPKDPRVKRPTNGFRAPPDRDIDWDVYVLVALVIAWYKFLVVWLREFRRTLEIIARTLREVVNRVRLCGHHTQKAFAW